MRWQDSEKKMNESIAAGNWDEAISHAKNIPTTMNSWEQMPSKNMPAHAMHKVVDYLSSLPGSRHDSNKSGFAFEAASNLPPDADMSLLKKIHELSPHDWHVNNNLLSHPNLKYEGRDALLNQGQKYFQSYEEKVHPHHFATVKSMFSGKPERIIDHRNGEGISNPDVIPGIKEHASEIQKKILNDKEIPKRYFGKEPYIKLYRGVNGSYGKAIRDKAEFNPKEGTVKKKTFTVPAASFSSWTSDPEMAGRFAWGRGNIEGQPDYAGAVMSQWHPIKSVLHSSMHNSILAPSSKQTDESEIIIGHPEGKMKINTSDMHFQPEPDYSYNKRNNIPVTPDSTPDNYGTMLKPSLKKSESLEKIETTKLNIYKLEPTLMKSIKHNAIAAATAAAMIGSPIHPDSGLNLKDLNNESQSVKAIHKENVAKIHPDLQHIKMIESAGGKNKKHPLITEGLSANTHAYGDFGLTNLRMLETVKADRHLRLQHPEFLKFNHVNDEDQIHDYVKKHKGMEEEIANSHWHSLDKKFEGDKNKMAYAWLHGVTGTNKASDEAISGNDYVQKFNKYQKMNSLQTHFNKSEIDIKKSNIKSFNGIFNKPEDSADVYRINQSIKNDQIHDLSNHGHFTHSSFVVGLSKDNSWLIKVDQKVRSSIESIKYGLQSVKEAAFFEMTRNVFGLAEFTPKAILGELEVDGEKKTCVAIRMYGDVYIQAVEYKKQDPNGLKRVIDQYVGNGTLHKLAAMMWILGDLDGHGKNMLTNGKDFKLVDHGSSFADASMNIKDEGAFIPYFLRAWGGVKDSMTDEEKLARMPKVEDQEVNIELQHWLANLDVHKMVEIIVKHKLDKACAIRLESLRKLISKRPDSNISVIVNELWVEDFLKMNKEANYEA